MTIISEISDRGAVVAWSPNREYADVICLGSKEKAGANFDNYGGTLELYSTIPGATTNTTNNTTTTATHTPRLLHTLPTATAFASLTWSHGLIGGGMTDGTVQLWREGGLLEMGDASGISGGDAVELRVEEGAVTSLGFCPLEEGGKLACGGASGSIQIIDLSTSLTNPTTYPPSPTHTPSGSTTSLSWNTQVSHILSTSSASGLVTVWDLRQKKPWCQLRVDTSVNDVAWNPTQGLHIMTASEHSLKLWDLRSSTSVALATLQENEGVLSLDWCPHDETLLLSCGKDNETKLWDLYSLSAVAVIPNTEVGHGDDGHSSNIIDNNMNGNTSNNDLYGGGLGTSQQKRYDVQWSPLQRGVVSTCSFDRKVQIHSVTGIASKTGRPPKWMAAPSSVSCGFGGTVVSVHSKERRVEINTVVQHPELVEASQLFEHSFNPQDCISYCRTMADRSNDEYEANVWNFMQIMFEQNAREELLGYLGFDPEVIHATAMNFESEQKEEVAGTPPMSPDAESAVKNALLVGNFEAAVECCFRSNNFADALLLASCGGAELWAKTQAEYFAREAKKRPFLSLVSAVVHDQLTDLVLLADPKKWKETLAVLSTYGKSEEFPALCAALGDRLEEAGDDANASLCYMCALNLGQTVKYWKRTLQNANAQFGGLDLLSLHEFIEKVAVFTQALDSSNDLDDETANLFAGYSSALANQGLFVAAAKYLRGNTQECKELRDKIYRSRMGQFCPDLIANPPEFPYEYVNVGVARDLYGITVKQSGSDVMQSQQMMAEARPSSVVTGQQPQPQQIQQQEQQSVQQQQVQQQQVQQQPPDNAAPSLPPGWVALQDPSSGMTYYANQTTGESSWTPPQPVAAPQPAPAPMNGHQVVNSVQPSANGASSSGALKTQKVANKYGDGFVTSASNPKLAEQYGNVGTSNPYSDANRPGTAAAAIGTTSKKAPVSGSLDPNAVASLSGDLKIVSDGLLSIADTLTSRASNPMEKKQATEAHKGVAVFIKSSAKGTVDADVSSKMQTMLTALQQRDYNSASSIMTSLVTHEWKEHRDWLKGMKILVQAASKKQV